MGLASLRKMLKPTPCELRDFKGRAVAVDANNLLWTFVTGMARGGPPTDAEGRPISHLIGLVNRLNLYADHGMRSAWVFDGEQPALKEDTLAERRARIDAAREAGDDVGATQLTSEQIRDAQGLLTALGIPWLVAPGESDAQCAHFVNTDQAWAAVTQDYDIALHGCARAGRNLTGTGKRSPELLELAAALARNKLTREQLVDMAILIGTDYNDGIRGVGPVKAKKLVTEYGDVFAALKALDEEMPEAEPVRRLFLEHKVDGGAELFFAPPDPVEVRDILTARDLSASRAGRLSAAIERLHTG